MKCDHSYPGIGQLLLIRSSQHACIPYLGHGIVRQYLDVSSHSLAYLLATTSAASESVPAAENGGNLPRCLLYIQCTRRESASRVTLLTVFDRRPGSTVVVLWPLAVVSIQHYGRQLCPYNTRRLSQAVALACLAVICSEGQCTTGLHVTISG